MAGHAISRVITELAKRNGLLHCDGRVNCSAFGRFAGLPSTTIMRLLKADPYSSPRVHTVQKISQAFGIKESQVLGYEGLPGRLPARLDDAEAALSGEGQGEQEGEREGEQERERDGVHGGARESDASSVSPRGLSDAETAHISRLRALSVADREEAMRFLEFKRWLAGGVTSPSADTARERQNG